MSEHRVPILAAVRPGLRRGYAAMHDVIVAAFFASLVLMALAFSSMAALNHATATSGSGWLTLVHILQKLQSAVVGSYCAGAGLTLIGACTKHRIVNSSQVGVVAVFGGLIAFF